MDELGYRVGDHVGDQEDIVDQLSVMCPQYTKLYIRRVVESYHSSDPDSLLQICLDALLEFPFDDPGLGQLSIP